MSLRLSMMPGHLFYFWFNEHGKVSNIVVFTYLWVNAYFGQRKFMQMILHTPAKRKTHYLLQLLHNRNAAEEMRVFQNAPNLIGKWQRQFWKTTDERYQLEKTAGWRSLVVDSSQSLLNIGTFTTSNFRNRCAAALRFWISPLHIQAKRRRC